MVEGRLNNYVSEKNGERGTNVQASCLVVLRRAADVAKSIMDNEVSEDVKKRLDKARDLIVSGNVISLRVFENDDDDEIPF